jgi:sugar transferase EpsL
MYRRFGKRAFDVVLGGATVAVLFVPLLLIASAVRAAIGSPVIFRQVRPGKDGMPFTIYKFRTMTDERDSSGQLLPDSERLRDFGRFLRSSSLDELPELINIIKGDMSFVGPRPLLMHYLSLYTPEQMRRHEVRPGLTGWAQVTGRNAHSWAERFAADVWYVDNISFLLDLKILLRTGLRVIRRQGVSAEGHVTMREFTGTDP